MKIAYFIHKRENGGIPLELGVHLSRKIHCDVVVPSECNNRWRLYFSKLFDRSYDIFHLHHSEQLLVLSILGFFSRKKIVVTIHNNIQKQKPSTRAVYFIALTFADKVVCNSKATLDNIPLFYKRKCVVIYNGVDFERIIKIRESSRIEEVSPFIFFANRLVPQKNMLRALHGVLNGIADRPNWRVVVAGDGPEREFLTGYFNEYIQSGRLEFIGDIERDRVYELMAKCSIYCLLSLWEGFGNSLIEATGFNCRIVHSNLSVFKELLADDYISVDPLNVIGITNAVKELVVKVGDNSFKGYAEKFDIKTAISEHINYYHKILDIS